MKTLMTYRLRQLMLAALVAVGSAVLLAGCHQDEELPAAETHSASVILALEAGTAEEMAELSEGEGKINSLRIYAFHEGKPVGHIFLDADDLAEAVAPVTSFMHLTVVTTGTATIDFYAVANEGSMSRPGNEIPLTENTSEATLKSYYFNRFYVAQGLPMFFHDQVQINFANSHANTDPAHEGHEVLNQELTISLQRPLAKLGVFAAAAYGDGGPGEELYVTNVTLLSQGTHDYNYLFPQTDEVLKGITTHYGNLSLPIVSEACKVFPYAQGATEYEAQQKVATNYTPVMAEPLYPFENAYANGGNWNTPGDDGKETAITVSYKFGTDGEVRTGTVYMPKIERNKYYTVLCQMSNTGKLTVEYKVAGWDFDSEANYDHTLDFSRPDYTNPIAPNKDITAPPAGTARWEQPTVSRNNSADWTGEGVFSFHLHLRGPEDLKWTPVLLGSTEFEYAVFQELTTGTFTKVNPVSAGHYVPDPDTPFIIRVRVKADAPALEKDTDGNIIPREAHLGISWENPWAGFTELLMINGSESRQYWTGSNDEELIVIKQMQD